MQVLLTLAGLVLLLWLPLVGVIVASRLRTSLGPGRRRFGRVVAFFSLWGMFNVSVCATWGAFSRSSSPDVVVGQLGALLIAQVAVPWLCAQIIATAPRAGLDRDR